MSRRRSSRSNDSSVASSKGRLRRGKAWLSRLFATPTAAGSIGRHYGMESLENRTMLTTFPTPVNAPPMTPVVSNPYYFLSGTGVVTAISYSSDVQFEAVGVAVNATSGAITVGDLATYTPFAPIEPDVGTNIYQLYVTQSTASSFISIYTVNVTTTAIIPTPYAGTIPAFQGFDSVTGVLKTIGVTGATGDVLIGALQPLAKPGPIPIDTVILPTPLGVDPNSGIITPGIIVAPINTATGAPNNFGNFLVGGTVTGVVSFGANLNEFYAGSVLTGDLDGDLFSPAGQRIPAEAGNFSVAGDLREFLTTGSVGTDGSGTPAKPGYITDFDLNVGGKIGEVRIGNAGFGGNADFAGTIEAGNSQLISEQNPYPTASAANLIGYQFNQMEDESISPVGPVGIDSVFEDGDLNLHNDTAADPQILGSIPEIDPNTGLPVRDIDNNIVYKASVDGDIQISPTDFTQDPIDYYGVALLAGQTITATVTGAILTTNELTTFPEIVTPGLVVIDPDGRSIASNSRSSDLGQQFTADRPGLYLFEINEPALTNVNFGYNLTLTGIGQMAIGGIIVQGNLSDDGVDQSIQSGGGDIGVIQVRDTYASATLGPDLQLSEQNAILPYNAPATIVVASGNLRDVTATSIGVGTAGTAVTEGTAGNTGVRFSNPLYLSVPDGSVGLVGATGTGDTDVLVLETQFDPNVANPLTEFKTDDGFATAIGGSIQVINAASTLFCQIGTNAGIGSIRAAEMDTTTPSYIDVNADNKGFDGIIDMIDVGGQFGVLGDGGPEIVTNQGGNVRYLQWGGPAFLPVSFGGEEIQGITYPAASTQTFTDDSGTTYKVTANGVFTPGILVNNSNGSTTPITFGPQFTAVTYPVLDKAGEIPVSITSTGSLTITATGTNAGISSVDFGALSFTGIGRQIVVTSAQSSTGVTTTPIDSNGNTSIEQPIPTGGQGVTSDAITDTTDEFLSLAGSAKINVLNVTAVTNPADPLNSPVEIADFTKGEVVNVTSFGVGTLLVNGNLGFGTGTAVNMPIMPIGTIHDGNTFPFSQQHTGVVLGTGFVLTDGGSSAGTTGDAVYIQVGGAVGNIDAGGTVQTLVVGASPITGQYNGIVAPIVTKRLLFVSDGQGILPSGTGLVAYGGLYATGKVGTVTGSGDIRGNIVSAEDDISETGIDAVTLTNASIIGALFETVADTTGVIPSFIYSSDLSPFTTVVTENGESFAPGAVPYIYDIGPISVQGNGGILGLDVRTGSVESVNVSNGGFGIFDSVFDGQNNSRLGSVTASGYGIRNSTFDGYGYIGVVTATGNGSLIPVTKYGLDVRPSDVPGGIDTFFGLLGDLRIDLDTNLGINATTPNVANVTDTGVVQDTIFNGANDFAGLTAFKARTATPVFTPGGSPTEPTADIPVIGVTFTNSITFGGTVGSIKIKQVTDGLQITAGNVTSLSLGNSVNRLGISVAGNINALTIHGNLGEYITDPGTGVLIPDSYLDADGSNSTITSLKIYGNLNASVSATGAIGSIYVTGYVLGSITANAMTDGLALTSLKVLGGLRNGALLLKGNVGSIIVNGGFGTSTGTLEITGNAKLIEVGANKNVHANALALGLTVDGTLSKLLVYGSITGTVHTLGDLTNLTVYGGGSSIITGNINVDGRIGTANINNGDIASSIIANGSITNFKINHGSLLSNATLESQIDGIFKFQIAGGTNYGLFGSLLAPSGQNDSIDISGNIGDGTDVANVTALSGNNFHVHGAIRNHSTITVAGELNVLQVDKGIEAGATITAFEIKKRKISGTNNGTITTTVT